MKSQENSSLSSGSIYILYMEVYAKLQSLQQLLSSLLSAVCSVVDRRLVVFIIVLGTLLSSCYGVVLSA